MRLLLLQGSMDKISAAVVACRALTGGHDRRLDHRGAPVGVLRLDQAGDARHVGARHGGAGHHVVGDTADLERQVGCRSFLAVRGDHVDAGRRNVRLPPEKISNTAESPRS